MPVTRISSSVLCSLNGGASRWIGRKEVDSGSTTRVSRSDACGAERVRTDGSTHVHRLANDVHDAPQRAAAHGNLGGARVSSGGVARAAARAASSVRANPCSVSHRDGRAGVEHLLPAREPLRGLHGDGADRVLAQVLRNLEHEADLVALHFQSGQNGGQLAALELHVHHGADDLRHAASLGAGRGLGREAAAQRRDARQSICGGRAAPRPAARREAARAAIRRLAHSASERTRGTAHLHATAGARRRIDLQWRDRLVVPPARRGRRASLLTRLYAAL